MSTSDPVDIELKVVYRSTVTKLYSYLIHIGETNVLTFRHKWAGKGMNLAKDANMNNPCTYCVVESLSENTGVVGEVTCYVRQQPGDDMVISRRCLHCVRRM